MLELCNNCESYDGARVFRGREHRVVLVVFVRPSSDKIVAEIHAREDF